MPEGRPHRATGASLAAIILALLCFSAVMLLHVARGDIDPLRRVMSDYANGSQGPIMTVVFYAFGLSSLALAFRLRKAIPPTLVARAVPVLMALAGVSLIAAGVFEVERPLVPDTVEEVIHSNASIAAFVLLISSMLLFSFVCWTDAAVVELPVDLVAACLGPRARPLRRLLSRNKVAGRVPYSGCWAPACCSGSSWPPSTSGEKPSARRDEQPR